MGYFTLELNLKLATVNEDDRLSFLPLYALFSLYGDPHVKQEVRCPIEVDGGTITNAFYNPPIKFRVNQLLALCNQLTLEIKFVGQLHNFVWMLEDISLVHIPVKELLNKYENGKSFSFQDDSYQLRKPQQNPNGALQFSYRFVIPPKKPLMPYPSPAVGTTSAPQPLRATHPPAEGTITMPYAGPQPGGYPPRPPLHAAGYGYSTHPYGAYPQQPGYVYLPAAGTTTASQPRRPNRPSVAGTTSASQSLRANSPLAAGTTSASQSPRANSPPAEGTTSASQSPRANSPPAAETTLASQPRRANRRRGFAMALATEVIGGVVSELFGDMITDALDD